MSFKELSSEEKKQRKKLLKITGKQNQGIVQTLKKKAASIVSDLRPSIRKAIICSTDNFLSFETRGPVYDSNQFHYV